MERREIGTLGERIACDFLGENGYDIVETNYRCPEGEIDIIAKQAETLVFVEVRTKKSHQYGSPEESITPTKQEKLRTLAQQYQQEHDDLPLNWRIDVVAIQMGKNYSIKRIDIIENAIVEED